MTYFRLNPDSYWITGRNGAAIYDISKGRLFLLDREARAVISDCEARLPLRDEEPESHTRQFIDVLVAEGLGRCYDRPVHVEKMLLTSPVRGVDVLGAPPLYRLAAWSITTRCEHSCGFCPHTPGDSFSWGACRSCVRGGEDCAERLVEDTRGFVKQLAELGFTVLHLRGSNPLLEWDRLLEIVDTVAQFPQIRTVITGPGTGRALADIVTLAQRKGVTLNVVLRGFRGAHDWDSLPAARASDDQARLLDALSEARVPFSITFNVTAAAPPSGCLSWADLLGRWGVTPMITEFQELASKGGAHAGPLLAHSRKVLIPWKHPLEFFDRGEYSTCLHGAMEIAADGAVRPCVGCSDRCGQMQAGNLREVLKESVLYELWRNGKNRIQTCKDCCMRFACTDCFSAERLGETVPAAAAAYCPVMDEADVYECASRFRQDGWVYRLSCARGVESCPTQS